MTRFFKKGSPKAGMPPGSLVHIGEPRPQAVAVRVMAYEGDRLVERSVENLEEVFPLQGPPAATWINVDGVHALPLIEDLGRRCRIHPLTLEDIVNTGQRPKLEEFDDYLYVVLKMLTYDAAAGQIRAEQVSLVLGESYLISFQEARGDVFEAVRARLRQGRGRIRTGGPGYLAYALMDAIVDHYFVVLEAIGEGIEALESDLAQEPGGALVQRIHRLKREMIFLRRQVWPLREVLSRFTKTDSGLVDEATRVFFTDVYDHTVQVMETIESFRDILTGMMDLHFSLTSYRMNEVMKVLTVIATIFIPLTFITGVYGMNFRVMPELEWPWGYGAAWGLMLAVAGGLVLYFRHKKWF
jgi:magnesium transporter